MSLPQQPLLRNQHESSRNIAEEVRTLKNDIQIIDDQIALPWLKYLKIYLWIMVSISLLSLASCLYIGLSNLLASVGFFSNLWSLNQNLFALDAFAEKSAGKATLSFVLTIISTILVLFILGCVIRSGINFLLDGPLFLVSLGLWVVQSFISLVGIFKLRKLLMKRKQLSDILKEKQKVYSA